MIFKEIQPSPKLRPYIKDFYFFEADNASNYEDVVFPSGNMEVIFNLGDGHWQSKIEQKYITTPPIELWGQITQPLSIKSIGKNRMLGIRFYTYSAAYFFDEKVSELNDRVQDAGDLFGPALRNLHEQLLATTNLDQRIEYIECFLINRLNATQKKHDKINFVGQIVNDLKGGIIKDKIMEMSLDANISSRYLNMLFTQYTGLQPKLFCKINRFQNSLTMVNNKEERLTDVAYAAGYFDQSHFIREFKHFTGVTPNAFASTASPINQLLASN